jgi:hypothetical protein
MTAPPVPQPVLESSRRGPNDRHSLNRDPRGRIAQPADLPELAVLMAVAPLRRSRGRSPILTVRHSNLTQNLVAKPFPRAKISSRPDHRSCTLKRSNRNANRHFAPAPRAPQPVAQQKAALRFVALLLTGPAAVVPVSAVQVKAVPASSAPDQINLGKTSEDQIGQDRTGLYLTDPALIVQRSIGPAARVQPAVQAALAPGNLAPPVPLALQAHDPSPPAVANPVQAVLDPATNAPGQPRRENPHGSQKLVVPADLRRKAARSRPSALDPADSQSPVPDLKANRSARESQQVGDPVGQERVDQGRAANPVGRSVDR